MPTIGDLLQTQAAVKRRCHTCRNCRVHGLNIQEELLCHCEYVLWRDAKGNVVRVKTEAAVKRMRVECERYEE